MNWFDIAVVVVVLVSALAGFVRGGAREIVTLISFMASAILAFLLMPVTAPLFRKMMNPDWLGTAMSVVVIFLIAYLGIHWAGSALRAKLHQSEQAGGIDRFIGLGFGILRALVMIGVFHLTFSAITPPHRQPGWFLHAKLYGLSAASAKTIQVFLPRGARIADAIAPKVETSAREGATGVPARKTATARPHSGRKPARAYDEHQRDRMDALVEQSR